MTNDYERFAHDLCCTVLYGSRGGKVDDATITKVTNMLLTGPMLTLWPRDVVEANQRARDAAAARAVRRLPELPRVAPPVVVVPELPRVLPPVVLPRVVLK